jgi:phage terminase large subunit-like protein
MQSPTHTWERLAALDPPVAWRPWLQRHQRTIALCGAIFVAGIAFGAGRPSQKTAVVVRIHHNQFRVTNEGTMGFLARAARRR